MADLPPTYINHPSASDFAAYLGGKLQEHRVEELEDHVDRCAACERRLQQLEASVDSLAKLLRADTPANYLQDTVVPDNVDPHQSRSPPTLPTEGAKDFGDYELLEEIARGGMGVVFKARQKKANRVVALKMILAGNFADQEQIDRFYTEAEAAANLDHPNIVPVFDVGQADGQHYFSMAYVEGVSLAAKSRDETLTPRKAASMLVALAQAVSYAHGRGIVHRDLKPANILLDVDQTPRITDFGLAKRTDADSGMTSTGQIMGTPSYMAPEQARGDTNTVGPLSDVYALGAILYQLVAGRAPFRAASVMETLDQVIKQEPVPPNQLNPAVDRDLNTIILKTLQKEIRNRYAGAAELADDLQRFLEGRPILARRTSAPERTWRWAKRNRRLAAALTTATVALVAAVAISSFAAVSFQKQAAEELGLRQQMSETLYAAEMTAADDAVRETHLYQATSNILAHWYPGNPKYSNFVPPGTEDVRGWEWYFLWGLTRGNRVAAPGIVRYADVSSKDVFGFGFGKNFAITAFGQSQGGVTWNAHDTETICVRFSRDGNLFATAGLDGRVKLWDVSSRQPVATFDHSAPVRCMSFDADHSRLITHAEDAEIRIWNLETKTNVRTISEGVSAIPTARVSPDGRSIAASSQSKGTFPIVIWDLDTGKQTQTLTEDAHTQPVQSIAWSPDGTRIVSGSSDRTVSVWDVAEQRRTMHFSNHHLPVYAVAWSPDGTMISSAGDDMEVYVRDAKTGRITGSFGHKAGEASSMRSLAWNPTNTKLVGAISSGTLGIVDLGVRRSVYEAHMPDVDRDSLRSALSWYKDGLRLSGTRGNISTLWPLADDPQTSTTALRTWTADGSVSAAAVGNDVVVSRADAVVSTSTFDSEPKNLLWSPNGESLAVRLADSVHIVCLTDGQASVDLIYSVVETDSGSNRPTVDSMAWSADGQRIVVGTSTGLVRLHFADSGKKDVAFQLKEAGYQPVRIRCIAWQPSGHLFAIGTSSNFVYVYDSQDLPQETGDQLQDRGFAAHEAHIHSLAWNPDGSRLASASADRTVRLWDFQFSNLDDVKKRNLLTLQHDADVRRVAWNADGMRLATLTDSGMISVFDATYGHEWAAWIDAHPTEINWE